MAASHSDSYQLSQDPVFQNRVQAGLLQTCVAIASESSTTVPFHRERALFAQQILAAASGSNYVTQFTNSISTDATVLSDATQAGTVALTTANRAAQAALVTDAHIDSAISGQFNAYLRL